MAVVASLALAGLSACRSGPAVAAYVGDTRITEDRVEQIWADARAVVAASPPVVDPVTGAEKKATLPITRADVVEVLVGRELLDRVAAEQNVTVPSGIAYDKVATIVGMSEKAEYVHLFGQNLALQYQVEGAMTGVPELSDEQLTGVLQRFTANGTVPPDTTVAVLRTKMPAQLTQAVQLGVALRDQMSKAAVPLDISVSPRYQPLEISTFDYQNDQTSPYFPLVSVPVGDDTAVPVADFS
ncbi:hypothetical protein [Actinoplanes awajinensis]|uniref:Lipoprotein n=1 Tax=Actinoplanes awajinensis subsp. mycoplanecinus TaxID=135947 RepID=A0A0X3UWL6_9ACTN|nr:hypothetical protein [Actinoplanes awajinensis]KUL36637.1 hypothetical protein ADL15_12405 [Actinoplanes awajinensis subsp. mycoplanecinus]